MKNSREKALARSQKATDKKRLPTACCLLPNSGFTLMELMVALMVASIVLAAVVTLAGATTAADQATDQVGREQSQLRLVSVYLTDLIRRANRVTAASDEGFTLWNDADADGLASAGELTTVKRAPDANTLTIGTNRVFSQCKNISFAFDAAAPATQFVTVCFSVAENGQLQKHSVNARLRVSDSHRKF
ncbi:MAG: prepilin-type N-terminal cleavage/methylation domain-containing protein [Planctomycetota bacterium]